MLPRPDNGRVNTPPTTTITPIVRLQLNTPYNIMIPHEDADLDIVRCRWAEGGECGGVCVGLPGSVLYEVVRFYQYIVLFSLFLQRFNKLHFHAGFVCIDV